MDEKDDSQRTAEQSFSVAGPVNSAGLVYRITPAKKNELKNAYNTDLAREMGKVKETEDK
jgi:hypothetical protein